LKGLGYEMYSGVKGIIVKPYEGARKGGLTGFGAGLGRGIIGVAITPVTGVLRVG